MSDRLSGNALTLASMVLWATAFPATDILLATWHPLSITAVRLLLGGLGLLALVAAAGRMAEVRGAPVAELMVVGGLILGASTVFLVFGIRYSNPVTASIISTMMPPVAALIGVMAGDERITPLVGGGLILAVAGGIWASLGTHSGTIGLEGGEPLMLLAVILFAWYSRASIRRLPDMSSLAKSALTLTAAGVTTTAASAAAQALGVVDLHLTVDGGSLALIVWIACIANGLSMAFWLEGAKRLGVTIAAVHLNLVPFYVMLMALGLGSRVGLHQIAGAVLVVLGAVLTQMPATGYRRRRA